MTRFAWVVVTCFSALSTVASAFIEMPKKLMWNVSASAPIGLYRVVPVDRIEVTDLAVVMLPDELARFLDERRYLPMDLPLLKRVLALGGTEVCRSGPDIIAYGMRYGQALERDTQGRPLPVWQGCRHVDEGEAFFMNWDAPDSFDSRYFGPLPLTTVVGRAIPLWTADVPHPATDSFRKPVSAEP
ncbi:putative conjugal transfer protein TraF [Agrobacterium albertimagni AOL15]|uniref:Putative conjugal transfer protein TraF n=1 Tax=Agrobacterium albertimagni AOL15 TaxID=1156935 RepID=K2Q9H4_9HYPH|nr:S26 family signal peptidase [Agrobacterium albertimagni]EKF57661.1 putative conjugal transfer protein TraF [Agrobacterium albertimagni AOL15]